MTTRFVELCKIGPTDFENANVRRIDFRNVYVTDPEVNTQLAKGLHLVLSAGIYHLDAPISVTRADTVILGIGFPTLIPTNGTAAIEVGVDGESVGGVRIASVLLQAGPQRSEALLVVDVRRRLIVEPAISARYYSARWGTE